MGARVVPGQSYSLSCEQIIDNPVPRGRGDHGGLQGFHQGQNPAAVVEQSVDISVLGGAFHDLHPDPGSPPHPQYRVMRLFNELFALFPPSSKKVRSPLGSDSEGARELELMDAGGL